MTDQSPKSPDFWASLIRFGRSIAGLFHAVEGGALRNGEVTESQHDEPPPQLALPVGEAHSEAAQVLTQHTPGWHTPSPSKLPVPTYAPAMTAFGIVFIALGAVTVWPLSIIGAVIFVLAIAKWIGELLHD